MAWYKPFYEEMVSSQTNSLIKKPLDMGLKALIHLRTMIFEAKVQCLPGQTARNQAFLVLIQASFFSSSNASSQ